MPKKIDKIALGEICAEIEVMLVSVGATQADAEKACNLVEQYFQPTQIDAAVGKWGIPSMQRAADTVSRVIHKVLKGA